MFKLLITFILLYQNAYSTEYSDLHPLEKDLHTLKQLSHRLDKTAYYESHQKIAYKIMDQGTCLTADLVEKVHEDLLSFCLPLPLAFYDTSTYSFMCNFIAHYAGEVLKFYTDSIAQHFDSSKVFQLNQENLHLYQAISSHYDYVFSHYNVCHLISQGDYKQAFYNAKDALMHWNKHLHNRIPFVCSLAERCMEPFLIHALDAFQALYRKAEAEKLEAGFFEIAHFCEKYLSFPVGTDSNIYGDIGIVYNKEENIFYFTELKKKEAKLDQIIKELVVITPKFNNSEYRERQKRVAEKVLACRTLTKDEVEKKRVLLETHRVPLPLYAVTLDASFLEMQKYALEHYENLTSQTRFNVNITDEDLETFTFYYDVLATNYVQMKEYTAYTEACTGKANLLRFAKRNIDVFQGAVETLRKIDTLDESFNKSRGMCILGMAKAFFFMSIEQKRQHLAEYCANAEKYINKIFKSHETKKNWHLYQCCGISWCNKTQQFVFKTPVLTG